MSGPILVLKIGGSFLLTQSGPDVGLLREMAETVHVLREHGYKVVVVVGGGITARHYIEAAGALGASKGVLDHLGILVSRINARVFIEALNDEVNVHTEPAETLQAVRHGIQTRGIVVLGGLQPGNRSRFKF
eukprot:TRINITY_DN829_c0_g1_i5.p1 TRINITY_DN829_c0_g1~~TRINITY_DN829_c0_g1_i5.p1  ORF type:complete len:132 (-),score=17.50 TRINITY_DN829_c0_g1_i5:26-421(-)